MSELTAPDVWVCDWCRKTELVRGWYEEDHRVTVGNCDRCGQFTAGLWHMVRRSVLDLMAEV